MVRRVVVSRVLFWALFLVFAGAQVSEVSAGALRGRRNRFHQIVEPRTPTTVAESVDGFASRREGYRYFSSIQDPEIRFALSAVGLGSWYGLSPEEENNHRRYFMSAKKMMFLAESAGHYSYSLAETYRVFMPQDSLLFKTGIEFQNTAQVENNLIRMRVDNRAINSRLYRNEMDVILMRKGLCLCSDRDKSCGGLWLCCADDSIAFLRNLANLLNEDNPRAYAFLNGLQHQGKEKHRIAQNSIEQAIEIVVQEFPKLEFKMLYREDGDTSTFLGVQIRPYSLQARLNQEAG